MSGHSKWHNIQHKKGAADAARSGLFTKLAREITMAAKLGDKNPDNNPRLRLAILTARKNSMPNDNIKRAIEKASGANTESYESVRYEGYGPGAVPVIVEALTDNPRRTVPEIRNIFAKNGGNMGEEGSVVFMFTRAGQIMYPASIGKTEDEMMEIIMDANADNLETSEEGFIITTKPEDFINAQKYLADILGEPRLPPQHVCHIAVIRMGVGDEDAFQQVPVEGGIAALIGDIGTEIDQCITVDEIGGAPPEIFAAAFHCLAAIGTVAPEGGDGFCRGGTEDGDFHDGKIPLQIDIFPNGDTLQDKQQKASLRRSAGVTIPALPPGRPGGCDQQCQSGKKPEQQFNMKS